MICDDPKCERSINNNRWARIKAEGWFFTKDGRAYCPDHIPEWVTKWRLQKRGN